MESHLSRRKSSTRARREPHQAHDGLPSPSTSATTRSHVEEADDLKEDVLLSVAPLDGLDIAKPNELLLSPELGEQTTNLLPFSSVHKESSTPSPSLQSKAYSHPKASLKTPQHPSSSRSSTTTKESSHQRKPSQTPSSSSTTTTITSITNKMPPPPPPLSSSASKPPKQPIPVAIQILAHSDRHNYPYTADNVRPRHAFTLRLLPRTRIRELCIHATSWVRLNGSSTTPAGAPSSLADDNNKTDQHDVLLLSSSFKARDRDGHALDPSDTVADALMAGETLFLIEKSSSREGEEERDGRSRSRSRSKGGDGVLLRELRAGAARRSRADVRTPSVASSSRSRSRSRSTACSKKQTNKGTPAAPTSKRGSTTTTTKKTPSQRALEIAMQRGRASASLSSPSEEPRGRAPVAASRSVRRARLGGSSISGGGASMDIIDTIEESPPRPQPSQGSVSRGSLVFSHEKTAVENGDSNPDRNKASKKEQQAGDDGAPAELVFANKNSPTAVVQPKEQEHNFPTAPANKQDDTSSSDAVASQQSQSLPSPALSLSLLPQNIKKSQVIISDSQDPPTPAAAAQLQSQPSFPIDSANQKESTTMARRLKSSNDHLLSSELGNENQETLPQATANSTHSGSLDHAHDKPAQRPASASKNKTLKTYSMKHRPEKMRSLSSPTSQPAKPPAPPTRPSSSAFFDDLLAPRTKPAYKPDPYEIITDDESHSSRRDSFLRGSARKLGSANERAPFTERAAKPTLARNSLLIARQPPSPTAADEASAIIPSTPLAAEAPPPQHPPTPVVHAVSSSSPPVPLPSSPTNLVAAVLSRANSKPQRREYFVIEESDAELDDDDVEHVLHNAQDQFSSTQQQTSSQSASEVALPWTAPPLRLGLGDDAFWAVRAVGKRAPASQGKGVAQVTTEAGDVKADIRKLVELDKKNAASMVGSGKSKQEPLKKTNIPDPNPSGTPMKTQAKSFSQTAPSKSAVDLAKSTITAVDGHQGLKQEPRLGNDFSPFNSLASPARHQVKGPMKSASHATPGKSPMLLVHGSSSSEEGVEEIGWVESGKTSLPVPKNSASSPVKHAATTEAMGQDLSDEKAQDSTQFPDQLMEEDTAIESLSFLAEDDGLELPVIDEPVVAGHDSEEEISSRAKPSPPAEIPKTDPITAPDLNETPPSAQASKRTHDQLFEEPARTSELKRKRQPDEEPEAEDQRSRQKRHRRQAREAVKAERKRRLEAEEAQREAERIRIQDERKKRAMEQAHMRAKDLAMIVSSPLRAAEMGLVLNDTSDSDQDEEEDEVGNGQDNSPLNQQRGDVGLNLRTSIEGSDKSDSLSTTGSDARPSWGELSRRHSSASPHGSGVGQESGDGAGAVLPTSGPAKQQIIRQDESVGVEEAKKKQESQPSQFIDRAFLEDPLRGGVYSPLETHNRIHLRMMHATLQSMSRSVEEADANHSLIPETSQVSVDKTPSTKKSKRRKKRQPTTPALDNDEEESVEDARTSPCSAAAPSPKDMAIAPEQQQQQQRQDGAGKSERRKNKDRNRKKLRQRKDPGSKGMRSAWNKIYTSRGKNWTK